MLQIPEDKLSKNFVDAHNDLAAALEPNAEWINRLLSPRRRPPLSGQRLQLPNNRCAAHGTELGFKISQIFKTKR